MLTSQDLEQLAAAASELHGLLRRILEASQAASAPENQVAGYGADLFEALASDTAQAHVLSALLAEQLNRAAHPPLFTETGADGVPPQPLPPPTLASIVMSNPTGSKELILVADHETRSLRQAETILTDDDYRVITSKDGFEAINLYGRLWAAIDLVILDFALPGISGDLVFDELRNINPRVAVVVSSGFHQPEKLSAMLAKGLCGFLPKPYDGEKLRRQIQSVLTRRRLH